MKLKACAVALVSVLMMLGITLFATGVASAADNTQATSYADNYQCQGASAPGADLSQPVGFVNFHLSGDSLSMNYHLKGAQADTTYYVFLIDGSTCAFITGVIGQLTTNSNGVANADFSSINVDGSSSYVVTAFFNPFVYDTSGVQTPIVTP